MMRRTGALALLSLSFLVTGCASTPLSSNATTAQEIAELKARVVELQRKAAVSEVEIARLRQQVAELEARGGGRSAAAAPSRSTAAPAPTAPRETRETARREPAAPATRSGSTAPQTARQAPPPVTPAPRATRTDDTAIEEVDIDEPEPVDEPAPRQYDPQATRPQPPAAAAPAPATPAPPASGAAEPLTGSAAQALYDRGYALYHQGHYLDAEASFQRFLQGNSGELADNAQYWIGESRYARDDLRGALAAFRETVERFPEGNKVPDALLKAAQCLEGLGDVEGARTSYREVARRYPGSAAAAVANERSSKLP